MTEQAKKSRGRPKLTEAEKAERKALKVSAKPSAPKATKEASSKAPKKPTVRSVEHDRVKLEELNDDQHFGLMLQHATKIASAETRLKKEQDAVKAARDLARSDLGKDALHEIKEYRQTQTESGQARLKEIIARQMRVARWGGIATVQDDLFPIDRTPSIDKAFKLGKTAGLAGEDRKAPSNMGMEQEQAFLSGFAEGQAVLVGGFKQKPEEGEDIPFGVGDDPDYYQWGVEAFGRGENGIVPSDVPDQFRTNWLEGFGVASLAAGQSQDAKGPRLVRAH